MTATAEATAPAMTRGHFQTKLVELTFKDSDFRSAFVADPKAALEKEFGTKMPENVKIFVHEEDASTLHFSIPAVPANIEELSDEDLEKVAGGMTPLWICVGATAVLAGNYCARFL